MKQKIDIIGAGLAGLITAKVFEHSDVTVYERRKTMPENHNAVLRFKTNSVGVLTNKDFKLVTVYKDIIDDKLVVNSIKQNNKYSKKVTGGITTRSISNTTKQKRFICDFNLQKYLSKNLNIKFDNDFKIRKTFDKGIPLITTMPMPILMDTLGYNNESEFIYKKIHVSTYCIKNCNVYQTIYYTKRQTNLYRASITKDVLIIECVEESENVIDFVLRSFGLNLNDVSSIISSSYQKYGKLVPLDDRERKEFIGWATKEFNIYSIGRFATWRNIQLDDVVKDAKIIKKVIENKGYFL